jgi:two-component sensor histidine kinase
MGVERQGQPSGRITLFDEANLLARLSERQWHLVSSVLEQAALADQVSAENGRLARDLADSVDRIQEVHHRVRNHLQTVTGLLSAQEITERSPTARRALQKSVGRLASIAAIHHLLARDPTADVLGLPELIEQLAQHLLQSVNAEGRVRLTIEVSPLSLNTREATALVLILTELISNAIEHGFPGGATGEIALRVASQAGMAVLEVRDNGFGLPPDLDLGNTDSLGLGLVARLAERDLGGCISAQSDGGAVFRVTFPVRAPEGGP